MKQVDFEIGIGGAAGQGIATPGSIMARIFARRGLHLNAYNAYQSIIRGGHTFLTIRASDKPISITNKYYNALITLNQDTMDRHLGLMKTGSAVLFDGDTIEPGTPVDGVQLCPLPMKELTGGNKLGGNTVALAATLQLLGIELQALKSALTEQFKRKGNEVVAENIAIAEAGYAYADANFAPFTFKAPKLNKPLALLTGNQAIAAGLVDEVGGLRHAIRAAASSAGIDDADTIELVHLPAPKSFIEKLTSLGRTDAAVQLPPIAAHLLDGLGDYVNLEAGIYALTADVLTIK